MSDATLIALLVFAGGVVAGLPPLALAWINGKQAADREERASALRTKEKEEDWRRQDEVAARTAEVAEVLTAATAATSSQLDDIQQTQGVIHDLVNSDMTTTMEAQLVALKGQSALMARLLGAKRTAVTKEEKATLKSLEAQVEALARLVDTRKAQQAIVDKGLAKAKRGRK